MTDYSNIYELSVLQQSIMRYVDYWVHVEKSPIPQSKIVEEMNIRAGKDINASPSSVKYALTGLLQLGYLRRTVGTTNRTLYVMLRRL